MRSATALAALRAGMRVASTCRRHAETTSRSMRSGATKVSSAKRSRASRPSDPSSPSATASTLASTTITIRPDVIDGSSERHAAATAGGDAVEHLVQRGLVRVGNQTTAKVFLQGLMCARGSLTQDLVRVLRNVLDLHTGHGAILAPLAPIRTRVAGATQIRHMPKCVHCNAAAACGGPETSTRAAGCRPKTYKRVLRARR